MSNRPITYQADFESPAFRGVAQSIASKLTAVAPASSAYGIWQGIRVVATWAARTIVQEIRVRRDTRDLMAMSNDMLKDIGLTRAEIGSVVRYGRN